MEADNVWNVFLRPMGYVFYSWNLASFFFTVLKSLTIRCYGLPSLYTVPYVVTMESIFTARLFATLFLHSNFPVFLEYKGLFVAIIIIFT